MVGSMNAFDAPPSPSSPTAPDWVGVLCDVLRRLRAPDGCPWDREQTHATLKPFLVEECAEALDAIDDGDDAGIRDELGDLLMHIVFHAQIAAETGRFDLQEVARMAVEKMRRRHPHVFGEASATDAAAVEDLWEQIKAEEKPERRRPGVTAAMARIPRHLPALLRAEKIQRKAAKVGFDWHSPEPVLAKIGEELDELRHAFAQQNPQECEEELGDLLFALVNFSRFVSSAPAEELLSRATSKFQRRFAFIEQQLQDRGKTPEACTLDELEALWNEAKRRGIR
jgi:tetrapyrrole methylase family protein/MazG family protein